MKCSLIILKKPAVKTLLLCLLLAAPWPAVSAPPALKFRYITSEDGLSNSTIECIFQDSEGFMWFGTRDGLNKYDGYQMTVYKNNPKDDSSISDNYIRCIYEDKQKNLWIGTTNGLNRFNKTTGTFTRFKHSGSTYSLSNNHVNCIYEDSRNNFWISTYGGGLNRYDKKSGRFYPYRNKDSDKESLNDDFVNCVFEDSRKNLWIGTESGLNRFNPQDESFQEYPVSNKKKINIRLIREDADGGIWLGSEAQGLFKIDHKTNRISHFFYKEKDFSSIGSDMIRDILRDKNGNIWVGCINGGLNLLNRGGNSFYHYTDDSSQPGSLSQRTVSALFEDNQGNLWVGTHRGGINLYAPKAQKFKLFQYEQGKNSLSYNDVKAFFEDSRGNIWIGTDGGGLNKYDRKENTFKHFRYNPYDKNSISCDAIADIIEDDEGHIWISTWGGGLNLLHENTGKFTRFLHKPDDPSSISSNYVQKILKDSNGKYWVATYYGGLNLLDPKTGIFSRISGDTRNKTSLFGSNIVSLNEDKKGNIWIGTDDGGLNCYNPRTSKFSHYFIDQEKLPDIRVIFTDSKGRLWVGHTGLYLYDEAADTFRLYTEHAGLAAEFIKGILEDESGFLWISTLNGLIRFHPDKGLYKKFNKADGLQSQEFEANAFLKTRDGEMFFGGINGFNSFYPQNIRASSFVPPVYLTEFQIFNKKIIPLEKGSPLKTHINFAREIILNYQQSTFSISFAALNYAAPNNNLYAYKLVGLDKQWNYVGSERKASYTNLDPGKYTFLVKASNNDGIWNNKISSIAIIIAPPFWKTWWFRLITAAFLFTSAWLALNFKRKLELDKLEEKKKDELHQIQLQFFTNISHEFRTPLTLILGRLEKLMKEDGPAAASTHFKSLSKNAARLMNLINELMDFRKIESGALPLKVSSGSIGLFIDEIADEFITAAYEKNLSLIVKKGHHNENVWFDRQLLEKILINLIHNSIKYTPEGGKITIEILESEKKIVKSFENELIIKSGYKAGKRILIKVADSGIGISADSIKHLFERYYRITESHLGSGIGLAFVKSLTLLHKGDIYVYSEKGKGTEITISLPCLKQDYTPDEIRSDLIQEGGIRLENSVSIFDPSEPEPAEAMDILIREVNSDLVKKHILITDDNAEMRQLLRQSLSGQYKISEAADGSEGLEKAKNEFPDLIISDVMMPGINGIDFCRLIREDIETSHIPFLMLTAKDSLESKIEGLDSGADFYFSKPFSISLLSLTIKNIFEQRQKLKDHYAKDHQIEIRGLVHSLKDREFMEKLLNLVESNMKDPKLDADFLCREIGMSKTKLYNKIKSITGQPIGEFIRTIRLKKAKEIMIREDILITEVMYRVGIQTQSYFTKAFKKEFGKTPTQFIQEIQSG